MQGLKVFIAKEHMTGFTAGEGYCAELSPALDGRPILLVECNDNGNYTVVTNRPLSYFEEAVVTKEELQTLRELEKLCATDL